MLSGVWGKKIGMTQVFSQKNEVVPVTVVEFDNWYVVNIKTQERDGYDAVQVGCLRKKFKGQAFSTEWLKKSSKYFDAVREVIIKEKPATGYEVGALFDGASVLSAGEYVDVFGKTKGRGFQGVVKRHEFSGGSASHGPRFGRWPGSVSFMRSQGRVMKGKKLPGHMGVQQRVMKNLEVIRVEQGANIVLIKGSVPGHSGALVFMQKI